MTRKKISYLAGRKMVDEGQISEQLFSSMQAEGLIGPSPAEERILKFPDEQQQKVRDLFAQVDDFNTNTNGTHLRLQVVEKETR